MYLAKVFPIFSARNVAIAPTIKVIDKNNINSEGVMS